MRRIDRSEILPLGAYEQVRPRFLERIISVKRNRRLSVGDHITLVFENRDTVLFQIQEMLRTERITAEKGVLHELETYNTMVPGERELFATLLVEVHDRDARRKLLDDLHDLREHVSLRLDGRAFPAAFEALPGEESERLPAVNYVRFRMDDDATTILGDGTRTATLSIDHPAYRRESALPAPLRAQLVSDLETP